MAYDRYRDDDLRERDERRPREQHRHPRDRDRERERGDRHEPPREEQRYGRNDRSTPVPTDETRDLIASNKVEGTPVYGRDDQRLGTIKTLMLDKYRGQVRYAVLAHASGFLGLDEQLFPVQWDELRYDERRGGYRVEFTGEDVRYTLERRERQRTERARNIDEEWRR